VSRNTAIIVLGKLVWAEFFKPHLRRAGLFLQLKGSTDSFLLLFGVLGLNFSFTFLQQVVFVNEFPGGWLALFFVFQLNTKEGENIVSKLI
jgi:hypothetical protein